MSIQRWVFNLSLSQKKSGGEEDLDWTLDIECVKGDNFGQKILTIALNTMDNLVKVIKNLEQDLIQMTEFYTKNLYKGTVPVNYKQPENDQQFRVQIVYINQSEWRTMIQTVKNNMVLYSGPDLSQLCDALSTEAMRVFLELRARDYEKINSMSINQYYLDRLRNELNKPTQ
jgi:hypothetical protein